MIKDLECTLIRSTIVLIVYVGYYSRTQYLYIDTSCMHAPQIYMLTDIHICRDVYVLACMHVADFICNINSEMRTELCINSQ